MARRPQKADRPRAPRRGGDIRRNGAVAKRPQKVGAAGPWGPAPQCRNGAVTRKPQKDVHRCLWGNAYLQPQWSCGPKTTESRPVAGVQADLGAAAMELWPSDHRKLFCQVLGRLVRRRDDLPEEVDQTAYLFIPKDPEVVEFADNVQDEVRTALLHEDDEEDIDDLPRDPGPPRLDFDSFLRSTSEAGGILVPGRGSVEHDLVEKIAKESGKPAATVADVLASMQRLGLPVTEEQRQAPDVPVTQIPEEPSYYEKIKSKKILLEKNLRQITSFILRHNGGDFGKTIARLKVDVYGKADITDYDRADLPEIERALKLARDYLEKQ